MGIVVLMGAGEGRRIVVPAGDAMGWIREYLFLLPSPPAYRRVSDNDALF